MDEKPKSLGRITRRQLFKAVPIGIASAAAVGFVAGRVVGPFLGRRKPPQVPEGSIFTPAKERDTEV